MMRQGGWCDKAIVWSRSLCHFCLQTSLVSIFFVFEWVRPFAPLHNRGRECCGDPDIHRRTMSLELASPPSPFSSTTTHLRNSVFPSRRPQSPTIHSPVSRTSPPPPSSCSFIQLSGLFFLPSSRRRLCKQAMTPSSEHSTPTAGQPVKPSFHIPQKRTRLMRNVKWMIPPSITLRIVLRSIKTLFITHCTTSAVSFDSQLC